ncbi:MAG: HEPN domain-containing protein [Spirochaetota bacterium]
MIEKVVKCWIYLAQYDFENAKIMYENKKYLYTVFNCQQVIEKVLNAVYVKEKGYTPPFPHNLIKLARGVSLKDKINKSRLFFIEELYRMENLNTYYSEDTYKKEIDEISKIITRDKAKEFIFKTEDLYNILKNML